LALSHLSLSPVSSGSCRATLKDRSDSPLGGRGQGWARATAAGRPPVHGRAACPSLHRRAATTLTLLCALAGLLAFGAAPGQALDKHAYLSQFSEIPSVGPHGEPVAMPGPLSVGSSAIAVDEGHVYVAESLYVAENNGSKSRLDEFEAATGAFVSQFAQLPSQFEYANQGVAVGHAAGKGQVYVAGDELVGGSPRGAVAVFGTTGELLNVWTGVAAPSHERFHCFECANSGGVAVDNSGVGWSAGDVYVADPEAGVVDVFEPEAGGGEKLAAQLKGVSPTEPFVKPYKVAVEPSNGEVLVAEAQPGGAAVDIFKPASIPGQYEFVGRLAIPSGLSVQLIRSIATGDGEGDVYVIGAGVEEGGKDVPNQILEFNFAGEFEGRIEEGTVPGESYGHGLLSPEDTGPTSVAADPVTHRVYVATASAAEERPDPIFVFGPNIVLPDVATLAASSVAPRSATLNGTVDLQKAGSASCQFAWGRTPALEEPPVACPAKVEGEGKVPVSAPLTGLEPGTTYYYRLQATNAHGTNAGEPRQDVEFKTTGPGLRAEWAAEAASTAVTLAATIDPDHAPTSFYFQYGRSGEYEAESPLAPGTPIGSGGAVTVAQRVQGLSESTTYHYRAVAVSEVEVEPGVIRTVTFPGPDHQFTTQSAGTAFALPDGRQWELVSPREKRGGLIAPLATQFFLTQASAAGGGITYGISAPPEGPAAGNAGTGPRMLAVRGSGGWTSYNLEVDYSEAVFSGSAHYSLFSEDLSLATLDEGQAISLASEASPPETEPTPYLRHNLTCASEPASCFEPLVTGAPGFADIPQGMSKFGQRATVVGATPDLSHVVLAEPQGLYEWTSGPPAEMVRPVSVLPAGEGGALTAGTLTVAEANRHAITAAGARVVWTAQATKHLYLRDMARGEGETVMLDAVQGGSGTGLAQPSFQAASSDGSKIFFTDTQHLTGDAGGGLTAWSLYECAIVEVAGKLSCDLTDLTPGDAEVAPGYQPGASEDGSHLYFVAYGALSGGENDRHERAVAGDPNLYLLQYDGGSGKWQAPRLIGTLSGEDGNDWGFVGGPVGQHTRVSHDGRYLTFMSDRSLTGYDNRDASSGVPDQEAFLYDAATGRLVCVSCNPTGARPAGVEYGAGAHGFLRAHEEQGWSSTTWLAAETPSWGGGGAHQPRYLSDEGRLFFDSVDALVPQDINHNWDVYEYEPVGVGSCSTASPTFGAASGGCVSLISSGTSPEESTFLDASENGDEVFFLAEKLLAEDPDTALDVYDAHVCSGQSPCIVHPEPGPPCTTADACRLAPRPQPPIFGAPASATFSGAGNIVPSKPAPAAQPRRTSRSTRLAAALRACRARRGRRRHACEQRARRRYAASARRSVNPSRKGGR
jgi:hypothetical protein